MCCALAGHLLDAAGATAETDNSHGLQTALPCPSVDGQVLREGGLCCFKFSLGGSHGLDVLAAGYPVSQQVACDTSAIVDDIEQTVTASASGLSYDAAANQYVYTWKTNKAWSGTCRKLVVRLADGIDHVAMFSFN